MSGATPDPSEPARDPDAVSRLKLTQALQRAKYAIAWERSWPHLARLCTVVGLFLVASWAGLWLALPFIVRAIGLALVVSLFAQLGDLAESMLKRDMGIKDMGSIVPGHGGALDRIDSIIFAAPAAFYLIRLFFS